MILKNYKVFQKRILFSAIFFLQIVALKDLIFTYNIFIEKTIVFVDDQSDIWNEETLLRVADFFHANQSGRSLNF